MDFPRLKDSNFPNMQNVDVYKYKNNFDYSKYDTTQMTITLTNVKWDLGSVHVGLKTIPLGNTVYFDGGIRERDEYLNNIPENKKHVFATKYQRFHTDDEIKLPVPFEEAIRYNYIIVDYPVPPVEYTDGQGIYRYLYFIRNVEKLANNTTLCSIEIDAWQTYVYDIKFQNMFLEQGHYPVAKSNVDNYFKNPIKNSELLLTEDINFSIPNKVKSVDTTVLNSGNMYAVIASTANVDGNWGSKEDNTWTVPYDAYYTVQGVPNLFSFAIPANEINNFLIAVDREVPQFKQTIQAVYFVSDTLLTLRNGFDFLGFYCQRVASSQKTIKNLDLNKDLFNYPEQYKHLAKLYTSPYAHIELVSDNGNNQIINIEDTTGKLAIKGVLSLAFPFLKIDTLVSSVGGATGSISFKSISEKTFSFGGRWYEYLNSWNIPTFAVVQGNRKTNDYSTHYDRVQQAVAYNQAYDNADNNATNLVSNNAISVSASNATTANTTSANSTGAGYSNAKLRTDTQYDIGNSNAAFDAERDSLAVAATNNDAQAMASSVNTLASVAGSLASADVGGAISSAITGTVNAGVNWQSTNASITVSQSNNASVYNQAVTSAYGKQDSAITFTNNSTSLSNSTLTSNTAVTNNANTSITANNASLTRTNAENIRQTAISQVNNSIKQAGIGAPNMFGTFANGDTVTTRPMALFANIVTQNDNAIKQTGDHFLRYGYMLNQYIKFETFNVMPKFSYWKCSEVWTSGLSIPDAIADLIRFKLMSGVLVWRRPEYITEVNALYTNKEE